MGSEVEAEYRGMEEAEAQVRRVASLLLLMSRSQVELAIRSLSGQVRKDLCDAIEGVEETIVAEQQLGVSQFVVIGAIIVTGGDEWCRVPQFRKEIDALPKGIVERRTDGDRVEYRVTEFGRDVWEKNRKSMVISRGRNGGEKS